MSNIPNSNPTQQSQVPLATPTNTLSKVLNWIGGAAALGLLGTLVTTWQASNERSVEYGRTKALLEITNNELTDSKAENKKLVDQSDRLQRDIDGLRKELLDEKNSNLYSQKVLGEAELRIVALQNRNTELSAVANKKTPCEEERQQVLLIEARLDKPSYITDAYRGAAREEALATRDKKYEALNTCLRRG